MAEFLAFWPDFKRENFLFSTLDRYDLRVGSLMGRWEEPYDALFSGECLSDIRHDGEFFVCGSGKARWFYGIPKIEHERALWVPHFYHRWWNYRQETRLRQLSCEMGGKEFGVSVVISNLGRGDLAKRRIEMANALAEFVPVHANEAMRAVLPKDTKVQFHRVPEKIPFVAKFTHHLCFENQRHPGYLTEKIFDGMYVGAVPLYEGDPLAGEWLKERSFVDCAGLSAAQVAKIVMSDDELRERVHRERERLCKVPFAEMAERVERFSHAVAAERGKRLPISKKKQAKFGMVMTVVERPEQVEWAIQRLREVAPDAPFTLISDGKDDDRYGRIASVYGGRYIRGEKLKVPTRGAQWWQRALVAGLELDTEFVLKVDPDTRFNRAVEQWPEWDCFGTVTCRGSNREHVQGGVQGFRRCAVERIVTSGICLDPRFLDVAYWAWDQGMVSEWTRNQYLSTDQTLRVILMELGLNWGDWPEVKSWYGDAPSDWMNYAVSHAHKWQKLDYPSRVGASETTVPKRMRFAHLVPYSAEGNLADAYNDAIEAVDSSLEWILITDADVMFLTPRYGHLISTVIAENPDAGLITCVTNRIGASGQLAPEVPKETSDLLALRAAALARLEKYGTAVTQIAPPCSGFFMLFRREVWKQIGRFKGRGIFEVDWRFSYEVASAGLSILRMDGLLAIHYYRLDGSNATVLQRGTAS